MLAFLIAPARTAGPLEAMKDFMTVHNAAIMVVVLVIFGAKLLGKGLGAV